MSNFFSSYFSRPIGLPVLRKVRVHNLNTQSSIQMLSISGNTIHFHCSFFTDKVNINLPVVLNLLYFSRGCGDGRYLIGLREGSTKIKTKQAREKFHRIPVVFLQSILFLWNCPRLDNSIKFQFIQECQSIFQKILCFRIWKITFDMLIANFSNNLVRKISTYLRRLKIVSIQNIGYKRIICIETTPKKMSITSKIL